MTQTITPETLFDAAAAAYEQAQQEKQQQEAVRLAERQEEERERRRLKAERLGKILNLRLGLDVNPSDLAYAVDNIVFIVEENRDGDFLMAYRRNSHGALIKAVIYSLDSLGEFLSSEYATDADDIPGLNKRLRLPEDAGHTWPTDLPPMAAEDDLHNPFGED